MKLQVPVSFSCCSHSDFKSSSWKKYILAVPNKHFSLNWELIRVSQSTESTKKRDIMNWFLRFCAIKAECISIREDERCLWDQQRGAGGVELNRHVLQALNNSHRPALPLLLPRLAASSEDKHQPRPERERDPTGKTARKGPLRRGGNSSHSQSAEESARDKKQEPLSHSWGKCGPKLFKCNGGVGAVLMSSGSGVHITC